MNICNNSFLLFNSGVLGWRGDARDSRNLNFETFNLLQLLVLFVILYETVERDMMVAECLNELMGDITK